MRRLLLLRLQVLGLKNKNFFYSFLLGTKALYYTDSTFILPPNPSLKSSVNLLTSPLYPLSGTQLLDCAEAIHISYYKETVDFNERTHSCSFVGIVLITTLCTRFNVKSLLQ